MSDENNNRDVFDLPGSSADDPLELDRIRQWMDHQDWDALDEPTEVRRDKEICIKLLLGHRVSTHSDFELHASSYAPPEASEKSTCDSNANNPSTPPATTELPAHQESKLRFDSPQFLGIGAFGIVFAVRDALLGMDVAIKILRPSKSRSQELRARFIGEAQVTASLCHPSIVRVYDTGQIGGLPYITSSKMDGGTLADQIAKAQSLSIRQAAWVVARISDSVQFAHSKAILHRDLKPSNILLRPCDPDVSEQFGFEPMLTDFGLAKRLDQEGPSTNKTRDGRVLGTVRYMSPEQARGAHSEIGTASDIFSLGIILYQLLLGKVPFDDPLDQMIRTMISEREPIRPRLVDKSVPADLEAVVLKCLAKEPQSRYLSAQELRSDLERFLRGEPVEAKKCTRFRRWSFAARKHPIVSSLLMLAFLTNCVTIIGLAVSLSNERVALERERLRVIDLVSVYTGVGDDVFAGKRIKDKVMLDLSVKMQGVLVEYLSEHPNDEKVLHLKSVLSHFQSIAYQRLGTKEQYIAARTEVLEILAKLLDSHPKNEVYRFQQFFSRLILADWLCKDPDLRIPSLPKSGIELLEEAHSDIERLSQNNPTKIEYLDALAATKLNIARFVSSDNLMKGKQLASEAVAISEKLWREHPDRPVLAKHAIAGHTRMASYALLDSENELAMAAYENAKELFQKAWKPIDDEIWIAIDMIPKLEVWADVLVTNRKFEQALQIIDEADRYSAIAIAASPPDWEQRLATLKTGLTRYDVLCELGNRSAAQSELNRLVQLVEKSKTETGFRKGIENVRKLKKLPDAIESLFGN